MEPPPGPVAHEEPLERRAAGRRLARPRVIVVLVIFALALGTVSLATASDGAIYPPAWAPDVDAARNLAQEVSGSVLRMRLIEIECQTTLVPSHSAVMTFRPWLPIGPGGDVHIASSEPTGPAPGGVDNPGLMIPIDDETRSSLLADGSYGPCVEQ